MPENDQSPAMPEPPSEAAVQCSAWLDRRYRLCKNGIEIQARTNELAAMEMRDINDAIERYDNWKRWKAHQSQLPNPAV